MEISGQYLTYAEYTSLGGTLPEMPFKILEFNARQIVDKYTLGRLKNLETQNQEVKLCVFNLMNAMNEYTFSEAVKNGIASENIDGYSISYNTPTKDFSEAKNNEFKNIVRTYLVDCKLADNTPYMYIGADDK